MSPFEWADRPVLRRQIRVVRLGDGPVLLLDEDDAILIDDPIQGDLIVRLDGSRTADELVEELSDREDPAVLYYMLAQIDANGLLAKRVAAVPAEEEAFWHQLGASPATKRRSVELVAIGHTPREPLASRLLEAGFADRGSAGYGPDDLVVALVSDYLDPTLGQATRRWRGEGRVVLLAKPVGRTLWVGPLLRPDQGACWECLAFRLRLNAQAREFVASRRGGRGALRIPHATTAATLEIGASLVLVEILRWAGGSTRFEDRLLTIDLVRARSDQHAVTQRPQCAACGDPELHRTPRSVVVGSAPKRLLHIGSHRAATAEQIVERLGSQVSPLTGVIQWVADSEAAGHGVSYNVAAGHNFVMRDDRIDWLQRGMEVLTGGKGNTTEQARASAIGEAVERYSGVWRGEEHSLRTSLKALRSAGQEVVDPRSCLLFSEAQYREADAWNTGQGGTRMHVVTRPFEEHTDVDWTQVWSLTHDRPSLALSSFCFFGHPDATTHFFSTGDTNGCAAGDGIEEAILQAFYELAERDAVAIWWYNRIRRPAVDLDSFDLPYLAQLRTYYRSIGREIWALDLTNDLGIPTFAAISRATDRATEDVIFGFAAHLDPVAALLAAFVELNQFLPAVSRHDEEVGTIYRWPEEPAHDFWRRATLATDPYLAGHPDQTLSRREDFPTRWTADIGSDVATCVELARKRGLEVFALDQTRADIPLTVARVIVPGLRHFWRRLAPGRLYDVPVHLGWLDTPIAEAAMNPWSIFV